MTKKKEWAWCQHIEGSQYHGPFPSRKEALKDAKENCDDAEIMLGHAHWPNAADYVPVDYDWLLECTDTNAIDDAFFDNDEPLFIAKDEKKARKDLIRVMTAWARKWLEPTAWTFRNGKKVKIR